MMLTLVMWLSLGQACPAGQGIGAETQGHCCWPLQVWSTSRAQCVGVPACPAGSIAQGETCVSTCPAGQEIGPDTGGHCCWPDQAWSSVQSRCLGIPRCAAPLAAVGEECRAGSATPLEVAPFPTSPPVAPPAPVPVPEGVALTPPPAVEAPPPAPVAVAPPPLEPEHRKAPLVVTGSAGPAALPPEVIKAEPEPRRGVVNVFGFTAFDFSELTQGGTLGVEINFLRKRGGTLGLTLGVGLLGCVFGGCSKTFLHFPLAFKGGFKLGSVVEWNFRVGAAPALIWRDGGTSQSMVKVLLGTGLFFETGRGGLWVGIDFLPNNGMAHVISLGWLL